MSNKYSCSAIVYDFVVDSWYAANWYAAPEKMDIESAALDIAECKREGTDVPGELTPSAYMNIWNELCETNNKNNNK